MAGIVLVVSRTVLCAAASYLHAQPKPQRALLALSKHDDTLAIVDPGSLKVIPKDPVGPDPHELIASSDGRTTYVSIYGFGVIDLVEQKPLSYIDFGALAGPSRASPSSVANYGSLLKPRRRAHATISSLRED